VAIGARGFVDLWPANICIIDIACHTFHSGDYSCRGPKSQDSFWFCIPPAVCLPVCQKEKPELEGNRWKTMENRKARQSRNKCDWGA